MSSAVLAAGVGWLICGVLIAMAAPKTVSSVEVRKMTIDVLSCIPTAGDFRIPPDSNWPFSDLTNLLVLTDITLVGCCDLEVMVDTFGWNLGFRATISLDALFYS